MNDVGATRRERVLPRGIGWMSAVVLFVLLSAVGLPAAAQQVAGPEPVAARCEGRSQHRVTCALGGAERLPPPRRELIAAVPRPQPRLRQVQCRGLPPPRAPTC